ncbi:hypothetical protein V8F06_014398 [Rhypophila decipiens]
MAAQLAIQQRRGQSEPPSLCSFPSNSGSPPGEAGHSKNAQISNLVANHTKSPSPPVGEKTRNSLPIDVEGACNKSQAPILATVDSSQCTTGNSIATGSGTPLCGSPGKNSITSECESEGRVKISTQNDFKFLEDPPWPGGFDIGKPGCPSPARSSRSNEHAKAKDTAGETNEPPKSPRPQPVVIDLTGNPKDHEPAHSLSPLQSTKPPGNKRKRTDSASYLNAPQTDREYEHCSRSRVKRRPPSSDGPVSNPFEARSSRVLLILEMVKLRLPNGLQGQFTWNKSLRAWTGSLGVYKIGRPPLNDRDFVVWGKVRPIGLDAMPVFISPTVGTQRESVVQGCDIEENTWEVSSGEFSDMLADPFERKYIGHIV